MKKNVTLTLDKEEKDKISQMAETGGVNAQNELFAYIEKLISAAFSAGMAQEGIEERYVLS